MNLTTTITETRAETAPLVLVLRLRPNSPEVIELNASEMTKRLKIILTEQGSQIDDTLSQDIRSWAERTIELLPSDLPSDQGEAVDYLKARVEELRRKILFDSLDYEPLSDAIMAGPGLITSREVLDDWQAASRTAGETCPIAENTVLRVHGLARSIILWARDVCPGDPPIGKLRSSVTHPSLARTKHFIYVKRAKDAKALHTARLGEEEAKAKTARSLQGAVHWRETAQSIERERGRSAIEQRRLLEESIERLQAVMKTAEQSRQRELSDIMAQAINLNSQLAVNQVVSLEQEKQIVDIQSKIKSLRI